MRSFDEFIADHDEKLIKARLTSILYNAVNKERNEIVAQGKYLFDTWEMLDYTQDSSKQLVLNL